MRYYNKLAVSEGLYSVNDHDLSTFIPLNSSLIDKHITLLIRKHKTGIL